MAGHSKIAWGIPFAGISPVKKAIPVSRKWVDLAGGIAAVSSFCQRPETAKNGKMTIRLILSRQEKRRLRKRRRVPASEWAERHIVLPPDASVPGPWRNRNVPYLAGILDASFFPSVEEITICAAPQCAKTQGVMTCLGYAADMAPGNMMIVFPDENSAKEANKDRLQPMIKHSPRLRSYLTGYVDDEAALRINLEHLRIYMAWSNSASRLASKPLPYVFLDEVDKFPRTAGKTESGPIELAKKRTRTFAHMRKIWITSSPTIESGPVWVAFSGSQAIFDYFCRCPSCGAAQKMAFSGIRWVGGAAADPNQIISDKSARYACEHCGAEWRDAERDVAVFGGEWRDRERGLSLTTTLSSRQPISIAFHVPAWISPFVSLSECAAAFVLGQRDKTKLKDFQNGFAAEPWKIYQRERQETKILALRDDRPRGRVPGGGVVAAVTAGVDTQDRGFWYEIRAWGFGGKELSRESWCIREGFTETFEQLEKILFQDEYLDAEGNRYVVAMAIQDAMGHRTAEVYDFCRKNRNRVFPSKGFEEITQPYRWAQQEYYPGSKRPIPGGLKRLDVNTKFFKDELSRLLEIQPADPGAWHYHSEFPDAHAAQLCAEYIDDRGKWACPDNKANHLWDCAVLNLCAHDVLGVRYLSAKGHDSATHQKRRVLSRGID